MKPLPDGWRQLTDHEVTSAITAFALEVLRTTSMGDWIAKRIGPRTFVFRVEEHTNGTAQNPAPHPHPGVTVYEIPSGSVSDDDDAPTTEPAAPRLSEGGRRAQGFDVSSFQQPQGHAIDWKKVESVGFDFCMVKATEGTTVQSAAFTSEVAGALSIGCIVGGYHFFTTASAPTTQAQNFATQLAKVHLGQVSLPPMLDIEYQIHGGPLGGLEPEDFAARVHLLATEVIKLTGAKRPLLYSTPDFMSKLPDVGLGEICDLHVANFGVKAPAAVKGFANWKFWQYSATATVPGIGGGMDVDVFNGTREELLSWLKN